MTRTYTVLGATGNTGKLVATALLDAGQNVRVVSRSEDRLADLVARGAEPFTGDVLDAAFLTRAFDGADGVYSLIPPKFDAEDHRAYQDAASQAIATALTEANVPYVVHLSSVGAHHPDGTGPIAGHHLHEERLRALTGTHSLSLRATFFMENLFFSLELARTQGILGAAQAGDLSLPMIATADIAAHAAAQLLELGFSGFTVHELLGPRDVSMNEIADLVSKAAGKTYPWVQFGYDDTRDALLQMGASPSLADDYVEMYQGLANGRVQAEDPDGGVRGGQVTIEAFAAGFAQALQA